MQFAINTPNFGDFADARLLAELAHDAEQAGWDGYFLWDHIGTTWDTTPIGDPWVQMAAMAMTTQRLRLGALITPIPRRRPWKLSREVVTLDHLSGGRVVFGVGIGGDWWREFSCYGEPPDDKTHAAMLDEGLAVITGLWTGEPFSYAGTHYQITDARHLPTPLQQPRIPIWVAGVWPHKRPFRRAAQWDGICPLKDDGDLTPDDYRAMLAYIMEQRSSPAPFAVTGSGRAYGLDPAEAVRTITEFEAAGVNWWQESFDWTNSLDEVRSVIRQGPPRLGG